MVEGNSMLLSPAVNRAIFVSNKIKGDLIQRNKGNDVSKAITIIQSVTRNHFDLVLSAYLALFLEPK